MDNAQKAIMIGVGLFITIIIISAVMLITSAGQDMINNSMNEVGSLSANLTSQLTAQYDGTVLTGSEVIAAVKSLYTKEGMAVCVVNGSTTSQYGENVINTTNNTQTKNTSKTKIGSLTNASDQGTYVPATAKYNAELLKIGDAVLGVKFTKK